MSNWGWKKLGNLFRVIQLKSYGAGTLESHLFKEARHIVDLDSRQVQYILKLNRSCRETFKIAQTDIDAPVFCSGNPMDRVYGCKRVGHDSTTILEETLMCKALGGKRIENLS